MTKKAKKTSKKKPQEQLKIPNTGRTDAVPEIEAQAEKYRKLCAERMEMQEQEAAEQALLTDLLKKHNRKEYIYEDDEGKRRKAFIPQNDEPRAKVQIVKPKKGDE